MWNLPRALLAKNRVKLLLNMVLIATGGIPRGGTLTVDPVPGDNGVAGFVITASGLNAKLNPTTAELLAGDSAHAVDAHAIQPVYTGILARDSGYLLSATGEAGRRHVNGSLTVFCCRKAACFRCCVRFAATEVNPSRTHWPRIEQRPGLTAARATVDEKPV